MSDFKNIIESDQIRTPRFHEDHHNKFRKLIESTSLVPEELDQAIKESEYQQTFLEDCLLARQVPKEDILASLAEYYNVPFLEYDEELQLSQALSSLIDLEELKKEYWLPLSLKGETIQVVAYKPGDPSITEKINTIFQPTSIEFSVALPSDIIRLIENNQDLNPNFPPTAGRTPLAEVRTWLAGQRTTLARYRTILAKGRTGLALIRTGIAFISIGLLLLRIFGIGYLLPVEALLLILGVIMTLDGVTWYLPVRKVGRKSIEYLLTEATFGSTFLELCGDEKGKCYKRTSPIKDSEKLRSLWNRLTPVMKRRFLASDRTDFAEERTTLASYRTIMARARTGLAFTRTGIAFIGLGTALLRQFPQNAWTFFDIILIIAGLLMTLEGLLWHIPGRFAGNESMRSMKENQNKPTIWNFMFPSYRPNFDPDSLPPTLSINSKQAPGIWGTTGLALDRTLLAERRNVKARLRTTMARSRTGMAFIRTGTSIFSIGLGLLVYFGIGNLYWSIFDLILITVGLYFIGDGFYWYIPAEKSKKQLPYCFGDLEIALPDYGKPSSTWQKVLFSHENL